MSQFPEPVILPDEVLQQRRIRQTELLQSCTRGIILRAVVILAELAGVWAFGSAALLMDALATSIDVLSSLVLAVCIKLAYRPPDEDHPFGHGRYEPLFGLQLGILMAVVGCGMLFQQVFAFKEISKEIIDPRTWIIPFCAVILLEIAYRSVMQTAKKQNSPALAADAVHYRIDAISSILAALALICAAIFPAWSHTIDHLGAIFIAALMVGVGIQASRQNLNQIMDKTPDSIYFTRVEEASKRVEGVLGIEKIRIQLYGPDAHVDVDVEVDPKLSVEVAHEISQKVRAEIQKEWAQVRDVTVHIEPYYPDDH